jgi:RecA/RadA recombinase
MKKKVAANRVRGPSRQQRAERMERNSAEGREQLLRHFVGRHKEEAERIMSMVGEGFVAARNVRQAIAFQSGIFSLDFALGGGFPSGAVEIYGAESVGKTTLLTEMVQSAQGLERKTALCASEFFDKLRYASVGVSLDDLVSIKGRGPEALRLAGDFITRSNRRILFVDSMTSFRPERDVYDDWVYMVLAWMQQVIPFIGPSSCVVVVNQVRARRSKDPNKVFAGGTTSAARRVAGMFDARLELSRENVTESTYDMTVNIVSNTLAPPARIISLPVIKARGIDIWKDLVRSGVAVKALTKKGSWYYLGDQALCQGEEEVSRKMEADDELTNRILKASLDALRAK